MAARADRTIIGPTLDAACRRAHFSALAFAYRALYRRSFVSAAAQPLLFHPSPDAVYGFPGARRIERIDSPFQRIEVWETPQLGTLFSLDDRPMTSVGDEFIYHECMVHPAALTHPEPRSALVLGGGDGGAARQLLRHPGIARIVVAELDAEVVRMARAHLAPVHGGAFDDARVEVVIGDAAQFVATTHERFDLVVFDLTPPDSPAATLYTHAFYEQLKVVMCPGAALSMHLGSPFFHEARVRALATGLVAAFKTVRLMSAFIPLYGSLWLMAIASDALDPCALSAHEVAVRIDTRGIDALRYYGAALHPALFALPGTVRAQLGFD